jgi:hypothetical protein
MRDFDKISSKIFNKDLDTEIHEVSKKEWSDICDLEFLAIGGDRIVYRFSQLPTLKRVGLSVILASDFSRPSTNLGREVSSTRLQRSRL